MRQLVLDIRLADHAVFATFHAGRNALAVATVEAAAEGSGPPMTWLWGPGNSGKSHLLQAAVARAHARGAVTAYLPLRELRADPQVLEGLEGFALVACDDVPAVAADPAWERGLFRLYESLVSRGGRLLAAAEQAPGSVRFTLRDLASRFAAGAIFRLEPLTDDECLSALQSHAAWRGFSLPEDTGRFLLSRVARDSGSLFRLLDQLDREALVAQKRLTIPFVKSVLERSAGS